MEHPVWFITGCSTGLGKALAWVCIEHGFRVVATARGRASVAELVALAPDRVLGVDLDVTSDAEIATAVRSAHQRFGRIDVLVNNAGYGYQCSVEEGEDVEIRAQFDANVFGLFATIRAVVPIMRSQRSGRIVNITSIAGLTGFAGSGYYVAAKHAVEGLSNSLRSELRPLGIGVTCVEPGPFRTDWAGRSLRQTPTRISEYKATAGKRQEDTRRYSGQQRGDPRRAGEAIVALSRMPDPPRHLVLGEVGFDIVTASLKRRLDEIESLRDIAVSADFPQ